MKCFCQRYYSFFLAWKSPAVSDLSSFLEEQQTRGSGQKQQYKSTVKKGAGQILEVGVLKACSVRLWSLLMWRMYESLTRYVLGYEKGRHLFLIFHLKKKKSYYFQTACKR